MRPRVRLRRAVVMDGEDVFGGTAHRWGGRTHICEVGLVRPSRHQHKLVRQAEVLGVGLLAHRIGETGIMYADSIAYVLWSWRDSEDLLGETHLDWVEN